MRSDSLDLFPSDDLGSLMEEDMSGGAQAGWKREGVQSSPSGRGGDDGENAAGWGDAVEERHAEMSRRHSLEANVSEVT